MDSTFFFHDVPDSKTRRQFNAPPLLTSQDHTPDFASHQNLQVLVSCCMLSPPPPPSDTLHSKSEFKPPHRESDVLGPVLFSYNGTAAFIAFSWIRFHKTYFQVKTQPLLLREQNYTSEW